MKLAIGLEKRYTKNEILNAYLNIAFFGDNTYGIQAAAQRYYSVNGEGSPRSPRPRACSRSCSIPVERVASTSPRTMERNPKPAAT